jgi:predicted porin
MNKKLLFAAVGAALVAGPMMAAQAETTVYGHMHMSLDSYDNGGAKAANPSYGIPAVGDSSNGLLNSNSSRFGIKGFEDIGGGLKAIYQVESPAFNADDGSGGFGGTLRNTYMGLAGSSWGSVKFGRHDAPVKDISRKLDAFNEEIDDSPSFSGIQAALLYGTSETNSTFGTTSFNVTWSPGPLYLALGWEQHSFHNSNLKEETDTRLGAKWNITPEFYIGFLYDMVSNLTGEDSVDGTAYSVLGGFKMGNWLFKAQYSNADSPDTTATFTDTNLGAKIWAIGVDHNFSKTTKAYLDYSKADNEDNQNVNVSSSYAGHGTSGIPTVGSGQSPSAISLGMIVNF